MIVICYFIHLQKLLNESEQQQKKLGHLNALVKQMEPLCDTVPQMERLADLSHKMFDVRARSQDKVSDLEDVNEQIEEYELELGDIKQWMEKTRAHLTMRDDNLTLKDQLHMQQVRLFFVVFKYLISLYIAASN